jgi:hypothetical protein
VTQSIGIALTTPIYEFATHTQKLDTVTRFLLDHGATSKSK